MINLENNFLENNKFGYIEKIITNHNFKFSINHKSNILHFFHILIHDYKPVSNQANLLEPFKDKIKNKIIESVLLFVPQTIKQEIIFQENLDILKDTMTGIYSLNQNNGYVKLTNVEPIQFDQNQMLSFNTNLKPKIYSSTNNYQCFIQLEYDYN